MIVKPSIQHYSKSLITLVNDDRFEQWATLDAGSLSERPVMDTSQLSDKVYVALLQKLMSDPRFERWITLGQDSSSFLKHKYLGNGFADFRQVLDHKMMKNKEGGPLKLLDVGGGDGQNLDEFLQHRKLNLSCYNLDIEPSGDEQTIVFDITQPAPEHLHGEFDVIYSYNAFEHFSEPHVAADNVAKLLKPDGICLIHTVFSWRYHPVPGDFFRFTDDGMRYMFSGRNGLKEIVCGYDISRRRENMMGGYFEDEDIPPRDNLGGFRENWSVYYIGIK